MTGWRSGLALGVVCAVLAVPAQASATTAPDEVTVSSSRLFTFADEDIFESSGLVDRGDVVFTVNDSGDDAVVYGVDASSGRTAIRTTYADSVEDVEAVAPGADGRLWVGDIGDNRRRHDHITVHRVRPRDGAHPGDRFHLAYPDGPHDAEALLVEPRTDQVFVVSKSPFGGTVYAAPRDLVAGDSPNRMRVFAAVRGLVTDGSFFPDGRHVVLRTYGKAMVYTFPAFALVGTVRLPAQPQGEGISVAPDGRVLVSTEGVRADVLEVTLPPSLTARRPAAGSPSPPPPAEVDDTRTEPRDALDWAAIALVGAGLVGLGLLGWRGAPTSGPRRATGRPSDR